MGFKGDLNTFGLANVFQSLSSGKMTGTLRVFDDESERFTFFSEGAVRLASKGPRKTTSIGEILLGRGIIDQVQLESAAKSQGESDRFLGDVLVETGGVSRAQVDEILRFQIEEEIYDLFAWENAQFEFMEGPPPEGVFDTYQKTSHIKIDTTSLLMEAMRRIDEWNRIKEIVPSSKDIYVLARGRVIQIGEKASPVKERVTSLIDGTRDVDDLVAESFYSRFDVSSALADLVKDGMIRPAGLEELSRSLAAVERGERPGRTIKVAERVLALGGESLEIRESLAESLRGCGRLEKAAIHYIVVGEERLKAGQVEEAQEIFEKVLEFLPTNLPARGRLAACCLATGRKKEAVAHYEALVEGYLGLGMLAEAKEACGKGLEADGRRLELRSQMAKIYLGLGDRAQAVTELEALAEILIGQKKLRQAGEISQWILKIDRNRTTIRNLLKQALASAEETHHRRARYLVLAGFLAVVVLTGLVFLGLEMRARELLRRAREQAESLKIEGDVAGAQKCYDEVRNVFSLSGVSEEAQRDLAELTRTVGSQEQKRQQDTDGSRREAEKIFGEARTAEGRGEYAEALRGYAAARDKSPDEGFKKDAQAQMDRLKAEEGEARRLLDGARSALSSGDVKRAYELTDEALRKYPASPAAARAVYPCRIETLPAECEVRVQGKPVGKSPCLVEYGPRSRITVTVAKPGFKPVDVVPDGWEEKLELSREPAWTAATGFRVRTEPALRGGELVYAGDGGQVALVRMADGAVASVRKIPGMPGNLTDASSAPLVEGGKLFIGCTDDNLYCLDLEGGSLGVLWKFHASGTVRSRPAYSVLALLAHQPYVFATTDGGSAYCIEAATGKKRWEFRAGGAIAGAPVLTETSVYFGSADSGVYKVSVVDGSVQFKWKAEGRILGAVAVGPDGTVYAGCADRRLYAFAEGASSPKWTAPAEGPVTAAPVLCLGPDGRRSCISFGSEEGRLYLVRSDTGSPVWEKPYKTQGRILAPCAAASGTIYAVSTDRNVYAVSLADGKLLWRYAAAGGVVVPPLVSGGMLYVVSDGGNGAVYAFDERGAR